MATSSIPLEIMEYKERALTILPPGELARLEIALKELTLESHQDLATANEILNGIKEWRQKIETYWEDLRKQKYEPYKAVLDAKNEAMAPWDRMLKWVDQKMKTYLAAERQRKEAEDQERERQAEAIKRKALAEARRLEKQGEVQAAASLREAAAVPLPAIASEPVTLDGTTMREPWKARVLNLKALAAAVAAGTVPEEAIQPNMTFLNQAAKHFAKTLDYPGVEAYQETNFARR